MQGVALLGAGVFGGHLNPSFQHSLIQELLLDGFGTFARSRKPQLVEGAEFRRRMVYGSVVRPKVAEW